jgi:hypothetical protein
VTPAALMTVAIVIADPASMRAAPRMDAPIQTTLWRGDWLEVRGARGAFVKVYDHRRERPGFVHRSLVRSFKLTPERAPALRAVMEFLGRRPGHESLGIGLAALYMKAAPAGALDSALLLEIGLMATQLARRASSAGVPSRSLAPHLDVAASYGVRFINKAEPEQGETQVCYDGAAFRQALALKPSHRERALSVLALTDERCEQSPWSLRSSARRGFAPSFRARELRPDQARARNAALLALFKKTDATQLAPYLGNRLRIRESRLAAIHAFELVRKGELSKARRMSQRARNAWLRVQRAHLTEADRPAYQRAALHAATARWAREDTPTQARTGGKLGISLERNSQGQTCIHLMGRKKNRLAERCTYGVVWPSSVQTSPRNRQLAVAVQHLSGWVEQWVFYRTPKSWQLARLAPAATAPELGYVEVAGWTPGGKVLLVREALVEGKHRRRFQILEGKTLSVERESRVTRSLRRFRRWCSAQWKRETLALRRVGR